MLLVRVSAMCAALFACVAATEVIGQETTPPDVQRFAAQYKDPDGYYAVWRATLSVMGYNTKLVAPQEAPTGYLDLLDPKWKGKLVKSHPGYSGTSLTGTFAIT